MLASDPEVVRYIGDGRPWPEARVADVARAMADHWRAHGFGWRVLLDRAPGPSLGFAMLNRLGEGTANLDPDEVEIGWWLAPHAWGRGLASEAAEAVCAEAFERVGAPSVIARIQPGNERSRRVAERLGMTRELETTGRFGEPLTVYRLER